MGLVMGVMEGVVMARLLAVETPTPTPPPVPEDFYAKMLERLLDATIPQREEAPREEPTTYSPGEYIPPDPEVFDWTDPFIGVERPTVARLAPGQPIPFVSAEGNEELVDQWRDSGEGVFEEWARDTITPDAIPESWVEPITWNGESE